MIINGYELELTCSACPEQYDVTKDGQKVGYLRLRHGYFTADYMKCGGKTVFKAEPEGDGIFENHERIGCLTRAINAIDAELKVETDKVNE